MSNERNDVVVLTADNTETTELDARLAPIESNENTTVDATNESTVEAVDQSALFFREDLGLAADGAPQYAIDLESDPPKVMVRDVASGTYIEDTTRRLNEDTGDIDVIAHGDGGVQMRQEQPNTTTRSVEKIGGTRVDLNNDSFYK